MPLEIRLPYNWRPRQYQYPSWKYLESGGTRSVLCWPRRHGKDDVGLHHTACAMGKRKGTYWYLLPEYAQARKSMWDAIDEEQGKKRVDLVFPPAIRNLYREQEMLLGYGGSTFQLVGADNYNSLVGSPPVGVVFSEYARTDPSAWAYLMPILEKNRGWAVFNSTPYGDNHFKTFTEYAASQMAKGKDWHYSRLTADQCDVYSKDQLESILEELCVTHGEDYGRSLWLQEYFTSFDAAIPGAIWGDCLDKAKAQGRIAPFAIDRKLPVYTGWDIGRADDTAIWFYQMLGTELLIFDYHSSSLKDIGFYCDLLEQKRDEHGIVYARHWLPHDARPRTLASGAGSMLQQMHEAARRNPKLGSFALAKRLDKQEQIQGARATFPHCRFHDTRCAVGLKALRHYHRVWDEELRKFADVPMHDWCLRGETQVLTPNGWKEIQYLSVHDLVLTPCGIRRILRAGIVRWTDQWTTIRGVTCTPEHRWFCSRGLQRADALTSQDVLWRRASWGLRGLAWCLMGGPTGLKDAIISAQRSPRDAAIPSSYIGWSTRILMDRLRQGMKSIIEMIIPSIMIQGTFAPCSNLRTGQSINRRVDLPVSAVSVARTSPPIPSGPVDAVVSVSGKTMPAWNVSVERDAAYFVKGSDGQAYLVSNSSHGADAFMTVALTWKYAKDPALEPTVAQQLMAGNPVAQSFGSLKAQHFKNRRLQREAVA